MVNTLINYIHMFIVMEGVRYLNRSHVRKSTSCVSFYTPSLLELPYFAYLETIIK